MSVRNGNLNHYDSTKTLLTRGDWMVCSQANPGNKDNRFFVDHECADEDWDENEGEQNKKGSITGVVNHMAWLIHDEGPAQCYYCNTQVPDEIQALLIMLIDAYLTQKGG